MVQLKYFGDDRDYFKYDLISAVLKRSALRHYVFVPMLTDHRDDNEGKKLPSKTCGRSAELLEFIKGCTIKSLNHWKCWLARFDVSYNTIEPADSTIFSHKTRAEYWKTFQSMLSQPDALVFLDPDTGLQTGTPSYLGKVGYEKYILDHELQLLMDHLAPSSVLMLYQHLPNDKRMHEAGVVKKLDQVRRVDAGAYICAYREDDLAFLFVSKKKHLHAHMKVLLWYYHSTSQHPRKSLHI